MSFAGARRPDVGALAAERGILDGSTNDDHLLETTKPCLPQQRPMSPSTTRAAAEGACFPQASGVTVRATTENTRGMTSMRMFRKNRPPTRFN